MTEQQPAADGFWMPSMREVWHQSLVAPGVMVTVQGTGIRIVDCKGRVWFDDDLRLVTVRCSTADVADRESGFFRAQPKWD